MINDLAKPMSGKDRSDLLQLIRAREKVAKSAASAHSAKLISDFEEQISALYNFDTNEVWAAAKAAADKAATTAQAEVAAECERMGIPEEFRPQISSPSWYSRGHNAISSRRSELRTAAVKRIEALEKQARTVIESRSVAAQSELMAAGLSSAALAILDKMPTIQELMPAISLADIEKEANRKSIGHSA